MRAVPVPWARTRRVGCAAEKADSGDACRGARASAYRLVVKSRGAGDEADAVIIGGASFLGGRGHLGHALVGALMIGVIRNALNLLNVGIFFQMIAIGLIIVVAVESDVLRNHLEARARVNQARGQ